MQIGEPGTVRTLQIAFVASGVLAIALDLTGSVFWAIAAAAAALAAAQAPQTPLTDALAVSILGPRLNEYGAFRLWASVGWGVGAIVFGVLFQRVGLGPMLPLYAVGVIVSAWYMGRFHTRRPIPQHASLALGAFGDALTHVARLPVYLLGVFVLGASTHAAWDFVPLRIAAGGKGPLLVGIAAGASAFIEIPFMRSSGSLLDRFGPRRVFVAGASVYAAASLAWAFVTSPLAVSAIRVGIGVGFGLTYVTLVVITGTLVPRTADEHRSDAAADLLPGAGADRRWPGGWLRLRAHRRATVVPGIGSGHRGGHGDRLGNRRRPWPSQVRSDPDPPC